MNIPLPLGCSGSENLPKTKQILKNCFNNGEGKIIARPGFIKLKETGSVARGSFVWNDAIYHVLSQELVKITDIETGDYSVIGAIDGPYTIETAIGFNHAVIVVKGGAIYTLDSSDTLTDISGNANFVACDDVTHINGRFVYIPSDGEPAFFSDVGAAGTVEALSYFDAEELPDKNNACFNFANTLFICGTDSIELFRDSGATPNPFQRVSGARLLSGYIGGLLEYAGTYVFVGREKDQDFGIYVVSQGQAQKISNEYIDLILAGYTQDELKETVSGRIKWRGYDLATFRLRRHSFGFYKGQWFLLDTLINGVSRPWSAGFITQFDGNYYTSFSNCLGRIDKVNVDYDEPISRVIEMGYEQEGFSSLQSVELNISQGFNAGKGSVAIMMSRDGVNYSEPMYRETGDVGQYDNRLQWNPPGGLGMYEGFIGLRIYSAEDIDFSISKMTAMTR